MIARQELIGCRRSGKSHVADTLHAAAGPGAILQDAATWDAADEEIDAALARLPAAGAWIVDNAEALLALASPDRLAAMTEAPGRIVLVRNRLIFEEHAATLPPGWQRGTLPVHSLDELSASLGPRPDRNAAARWLLAWSGGLGGLCWDLAPHVPRWAAEDQPPRALDRLAHDWIRGTGLRAHGTVLGALLEDRLPPPALLSEEGRVSLGFLRALGVIREGPVSSGWSKLVQGRLWDGIARRAASPLPPVPPAAERTASALARAVAAAPGLLVDFAATLDLPPDEVFVWDALRAAIAFSGAAPRHARPLADSLGDCLGRAGLAPLLGRMGLGRPRGEPVHELAARLLAAAGAA